ncbi:hypothetical protein H4R26_004904, partial [Coemansia thaxteri]
SPSALAAATVVLEKSRVAVRIECPAHIPASLAQIQQFPPLVAWLHSLDRQLAAGGNQRITVRALRIQSADVFGPGNVGFVKFAADASDGEGHVPGVVFLRGDSVAVLLILRSADQCSEERVPSFRDARGLAVVVEQPRAAVPSAALRELPAGMMDAGGVRFAAAAVRELLEETGVCVEPHELVDLTGPRPLLASPGACDEAVALLACEKTLHPDAIAAIAGRRAGLRAAGERTTVRLVRLCDLWACSRDMKTVAALALWDRRHATGDC